MIKYKQCILQKNSEYQTSMDMEMDNGYEKKRIGKKYKKRKTF